MAAAGNLPKQHRVPGVDQYLLSAYAEGAQELDQDPDGERFDADHPYLHPSDGRANAGDEQEKHLCTRGIKGVGVGAAIDVGVDIEVAQKGEMRIRGNVAIGIDAGRLYLSVPHVAENIGGQK